MIQYNVRLGDIIYESGFYLYQFDDYYYSVINYEPVFYNHCYWRRYGDSEE